MQEIFQGRIRDISSEGHGVVDHPEGRVFFVRGTWPGDEGEFVIESVHKKYGTARISQLTVHSPARRQSPCPHYGIHEGSCGGCPWIYVNPEAQLVQKQKRVEYLIQRHSLVKDVSVIKPAISSPLEFGYRNRAQFKTDGRVIGYVSPQTKTIAAIDDCIILTEKNRQTLRDLRVQLPKKEWEPRSSYLWNIIEIDDDIDAKQIVLNQRRRFQQGNSLQNDFMKAWTREKVKNLDKTKPVVELFAGSGNFTKVFVDEGFQKIYSAEMNEKAVQNLKSHNWPGVQGFVVDLFQPAQWKKIPVEVRSAEVLFLDPPREGFQFLAKFVESFPKLKHIVYVSCEPYEWAGNIRHLVSGNWNLVEAQPLDQFPHTPHIELLSIFEKK